MQGLHDARPAQPGRAWRELEWPEQRPPRGQLFQTSLMAALLDGVYEGEMTFAELQKQGDFGLGTFNDLDGEMVALDGVFYQLRSDGTAHAAAPDQRSPFSVVTFFQPQRELTLAGRTDKTTLFRELEQATEANLFTAVLVQGEFATVSTRTVERQTIPFPPLTVAAKHEAIRTFTNVRGALVGFRTPTFAQGIGVAGFHLHFLREDRKAGGHVLDLIIGNVTVQVAQLQDIRIQLPSSIPFLRATLSGASLDQGIRASEG